MDHNPRDHLSLKGTGGIYHADVLRVNEEADLNSFPPGYRFFPTDEELIRYYLLNKVFNRRLPVNKIRDVNIYNYNPQQLAEIYKPGAEKVMYFFTPRDRKYPNGSRPNRTAGKGYWKATGADHLIPKNGRLPEIGYKKALVFYEGKPKQSTKTNWIMHEYRVNKSNVPSASRATRDMKLDDWVLCKVYERVEKVRKTKERDIVSNSTVPDEGGVMRDIVSNSSVPDEGDVIPSPTLQPYQLPPVLINSFDPPYMSDMNSSFQFHSSGQSSTFGHDSYNTRPHGFADYAFAAQPLSMYDPGSALDKSTVGGLETDSYMIREDTAENDQWLQLSDLPFDDACECTPFGNPNYVEPLCPIESSRKCCGHNL